MSSIASLDRLLRPQSIAIVGLSADSTKHGARVLTFLRRFGFAGPIWGINPKTPDVDGIDVFAQLSDLPSPPDALVLAVPPPVIPQILEQAGASGAGGAVIFSGGFAEAGPDGVALQAHIAQIARSTGLRLIGPNSAGVVHAAANTVMSFLTCLERPANEIRSGPVGLITQSGGAGSYIHNLAASQGTGLAISISMGNEADIQAGEALAYLVDHPDVKAIAIVMETVRDGPQFLRAARAARRAGKPVIVTKIGLTATGSKIMSTHTGALAGPERVYDAAFEALGITRTGSPDELFEVAQLMAHARRPTAHGVGMITHSGGAAIMLADRADALGVSLPPPSPQLKERLGPLLQFGATGNPTDLGGIVTQPQRFAEVVRHFLDDPAYGAVVAVSTPHPPPHTVDRARALADLHQTSDKPLINLWLAGNQADEGLRILRHAGAPLTTSMDAAVHALHGLVRLATQPDETGPANDTFQSARDTIAKLLAEHQGKGALTLSETDGKRLLRDLDLNVIPGEAVADEAAALRLAETLGYPVVLKVVSPDIAHKSDAGGVQLNIQDPDDLRLRWRAMFHSVADYHPQARINGGLVEKYLPGAEMIVGIVRDAIFGPMLLVGSGGVQAEALDDVALALAPVSQAQAARMIAGLRGAPLLTGFRGRPSADTSELVRIVAQLSRAAVATAGDIAELDINPLLFSEGRWWVADALIRLSRATDTAG